MQYCVAPNLMIPLMVKQFVTQKTVFIINIENKLHWVLDMTFREDEQRKRSNHVAAYFAIVRKTGLNLLKKDTGKESLRSKKLKAAWSKDFLIGLLKIQMR